MTLKDVIRDDGLVLVTPTEFGEPVTYLKRNGFSRAISAVVIRQTVTVLGEDGDSVLPIFEVHVHNNNVTGISSDELNRGGDGISIPVKVGELATRRTITRLIDHDEGMLVLECR
jgi:hypothetical protein